MYTKDLCVELGTWNDKGNEGWEEELTIAENSVLEESKVTIKEKRRQERQSNRHIRAQQKRFIAGSHPTLGIKSVS